MHTREGRSGVGSWRSDNNTRGAHIAVRALYSRCSVHICVYASVLKSRTALRPFVRSRVARINRSLSSRFLPLPSIAHSDRIFVTFQKKGGKQGGVSHAMDEITSTRYPRVSVGDDRVYFFCTVAFAIICLYHFINTHPLCLSGGVKETYNPDSD